MTTGATKPCPACGKRLNLPTEYLDAVKRIRERIEKYRCVLVQDFIQNDLKQMLFQIAESHSKLSQAEYNRNPGYNDQHFSHKAEERLIAFLVEFELMDEFTQKEE